MQMSHSMQFSTRLLYELETERQVLQKPDELLGSLAYPLLRRLEKRAHTEKIRAEVIQSVTRCLRARLSALDDLSGDDFQLFDYMIRLWTKDPDRYEDILVDLVKLIPRDWPPDLDAISSMLGHAGKLSHRLLRIVLKHLRRFHIDLENDDDLQKLVNSWPVSIFFSLPRQDSRALLNRLTRLHAPGVYFVDWRLAQNESSLFQYYFDYKKNLGTLQVRTREWRGSCHYTACSTFDRPCPTRESFIEEGDNGRTFLRV